MSLRETLLSRGNRRYKPANVDGVEYWVQTLTPAESMKVTLTATDLATGQHRPEKLAEMQATQLCYSLVDGEGGDRLFTDDEVGKLLSIDTPTFSKLWRASEDLNGRGVDEAETLGKSDLTTD